MTAHRPRPGLIQAWQPDIPSQPVTVHRAVIESPAVRFTVVVDFTRFVQAMKRLRDAADRAESRMRAAAAYLDADE